MAGRRGHGLEHLSYTACRLALEALDAGRTHLATRAREPLQLGWAPPREAWQGAYQPVRASGLARGLEAQMNRNPSSDTATQKRRRSAGGSLTLVGGYAVRQGLKLRSPLLGRSLDLDLRPFCVRKPWTPSTTSLPREKSSGVSPGRGDTMKSAPGLNTA